MIQKISVNSQSNSKQSFKGGPLDIAVAGLQMCEVNPMVNVSVADLATAIVPRTVIEAQTNAYAGLEAFRRESSGLFINCLIPGFIVAGIAKMIAGTIMGGKTQMANCWANEDTIRLVSKYWQEAEGADDKAKAHNTIKNILKDTTGIDGDETVDFAKYLKEGKFDESINQITDEVFNPKSKPTIFTKAWFEQRKADKAAKEAADIAGKEHFDSPVSRIVSQTRVAENIKIAGHVDPKTGKQIEGFFSQSLGDVLGNTPNIIRELISKQKADPTKLVEEITKDFADRASHLVTRKSLLGLGIIIPLAIAAQPINRWITEKTSGKKGAPIYKDFTQSENRKQTASEKAALASQKIISVSTMIGVALLSIMKKPNMAMLKSITQFKGIFPSMDQARIISTATFASRMAASQDKNDLREATVRDIATFSAFYFLGDYVAKGFASAFEYFSKDTKLINDLSPLKTGEKRNILQKIWHWTKNTAIKSSDELQVRMKNGQLDKVATQKLQRMRSLCQLGNLAFSLVALGVVIPNMYRKKTDKEREKELKEMGMDQKTINKYYPAFTKNIAQNGKTDVFSAFN